MQIVKKFTIINNADMQMTFDNMKDYLSEYVQILTVHEDTPNEVYQGVESVSNILSILPVLATQNAEITLYDSNGELIGDYKDFYNLPVIESTPWVN